MHSFIERLRKITGSGSSDKEAQSEQGDLVNPGMPEKKWQEILAIAQSDPRKMNDLRQMLADYKARQAMAETAGGRKAYIKEAVKSADEERLRQERQKAIENTQIQRFDSFEAIIYSESRYATRQESQQQLALGFASIGKA